MTDQRRGVTRGYVGGLLFATLAVASALVVSSWGLLSLTGNITPVTTENIAKWVAPLAIVVALAMLAWGLWQQALLLLRGRRAPSWAHVIILGDAAYLVWCAIGTVGGLSIEETWTSAYAFLLIPIWMIASLLFWAVLMRRIYTDRGVPKWPWEKREERERQDEERRGEGPDWREPGGDGWIDPDGPNGR